MVIRAPVQDGGDMDIVPGPVLPDRQGVDHTFEPANRARGEHVQNG
ncbi:MAG: hypothetical protein DIU52_006710 [bacterium]